MTNQGLIRLKPIIPAVILLLGGLVGVPETSKSDWTGLPKYSEEEIRRAVIVYAKHYRLDPALLQAIIRVESNFRQDAVSRRGAVGLMQLMPGTASRLQVANIHDSLQNIQGGAKQLRHLLDIYHGNLRLALAAYNAGAHRRIQVRRLARSAGGRPGFRRRTRKVVRGAVRPAARAAHL